MLKTLSDKVFDCHDVTFADITTHAYYHGISVAESVLEMLSATKTPQSTIHHHRQPCAQYLTLLHTNRRSTTCNVIIWHDEQY